MECDKTVFSLFRINITPHLQYISRTAVLSAYLARLQLQLRSIHHKDKLKNSYFVPSLFTQCAEKAAEVASPEKIYPVTTLTNFVFSGYVALDAGKRHNYMSHIPKANYLQFSQYAGSVKVKPR